MGYSFMLRLRQIEYACFAAALVQVTQYLNLIAEEKMLFSFFFEIKK